MWLYTIRVIFIPTRSIFLPKCALWHSRNSAHTLNNACNKRTAVTAAPISSPAKKDTQIHATAFQPN
jgi:hypothetical protein